MSQCAYVNTQKCLVLCIAFVGSQSFIQVYGCKNDILIDIGLLAQLEIRYTLTLELLWLINKVTKMSCSICTEQFQQTQQPKVLTCGHTFCLECISNWFRTQQEQYYAPSGTVQCPNCRRNTSLPVDGSGVAALPTNFALLELVEESEASVDDGSDVSKTTCSIHTGKTLEYSCETCSGELVCGQCVKSKHQPATGHRIINLLTAMEREQKEKADLQRKVLELQQRNSELTCSTSFTISKPNHCDNDGQIKVKAELAEILKAKKLLKTNISQGESSSSDSRLVSTPAREMVAVDKANNDQVRLEQMLSPSPQHKNAVSSSEDLYGSTPSDSSLSGRPAVLPKPVRRSRSAKVLQSTEQNTAVSSSEDLYGQNSSDSSLLRKPNVLPKPVCRSRPHSVGFNFGATPDFSPSRKPNISQKPINSPHPQTGGFSLGGTPNLNQSRKPNVSPNPTARPHPDLPSPLQGGGGFSFSPNAPQRNPPARNPHFSGPIDRSGSIDSLVQPDETDSEMLSARDKLAMILQSSQPRSPQS